MRQTQAFAKRPCDFVPDNTGLYPPPTPEWQSSSPRGLIAQASRQKIIRWVGVQNQDLLAVRRQSSEPPWIMWFDHSYYNKCTEGESEGVFGDKKKKKWTKKKALCVSATRAPTIKNTVTLLLAVFELWLIGLSLKIDCLTWHEEQQESLLRALNINSEAAWPPDFVAFSNLWGGRVDVYFELRFIANMSNVSVKYSNNTLISARKIYAVTVLEFLINPSHKYTVDVPVFSLCPSVDWTFQF